MRWPFSKKDRELRIPSVDSQRWSVARADSGRGPVLVRSNDAARELRGHPALPIKLGFVVPLNRPNEGGLPDAEENEQLAAVEDLIATRVLAAGAGVHALTLTTGVMKEWVFYVATGLDIAGLHAEVQDSVSSHEVQCMAVQEPGWESYREFTP
jgi:hypothetical protein